VNALGFLIFLTTLALGVWGLAFGIVILFPHLSAARRHLVWQAAFAVILAGSPLAFVDVRVEIPLMAVATTKTFTPPEQTVSPTPTDEIISPTSDSLPRHRSEAAQPTPKNLFTLEKTLLSIWGLGVGLVLISCAAGFFVLGGVRRRARWLGNVSPTGRLCQQAGGVPVFASREIDVPMAVGILFPAVLIPDSLLPEDGRQWRAVLLHEMSHIRRGDVATLALARLVAGLHWFNPFAWLALSQLRAESEAAADDDATRLHPSPTDYAECLLGVVRRLKVSRRRLFPALEMAHTNEITSRVTRLLDARIDRSSPCGLVRGMVLVVAVALGIAGLVVRPVAAQQPTLSNSGTPLVIRCLDADGLPVAGAEIYLYVRPGKTLMYRGGAVSPNFAQGPVTTDTQGKASLTLPTSEDEPFFANVLACLPDRFVGGISLAELPKDGLLTVPMHPASKITGRVTLEGGGSLKDVKVRILRWTLMNTDPQQGWALYPSLENIPAPSFVEVKPDDGGHFELRNVPANSSTAVAALGPGFGLTQALSLPGHASPLNILLRKEGIIEGTLIDADTGKPAIGAKITARPDPRGGLRGDLIPYEAITDSLGRFRIDALREGSYSITLDWTGGWTMQQYNFDVKAGEIKTATLKREKGTVVSGKVIREGDNQPISNVMISAVSGDIGGEGLDSSVTTEDGQYSLLLPPGDTLLYVASRPKGYAYPKDQARRVISLRDGTVTGGSLDFTLQTSTALPLKQASATGRVVDEHGLPLANVLISARQEPLPENEFPMMRSGPIDSSGADGTFVLTLDPNCKYVISAGGVTHSVAKAKPFDTGSGTKHQIGDLAIRPANATAEGVVLDGKGQPIPNAEIEPSSAHKTAWRVNTVTTDAEGRFRLPHLLPDEPFKITISAKGYEYRHIQDITPGTKDIRVILPPEKIQMADVKHTIRIAMVSETPTPTTRKMDFKDRGKTRELNVERAPLLTERDIEAVGRSRYSRAALQVFLTSDGEKKFAAATKNLQGRTIAIVIDGRVVSAPYLQTTEFGRSLEIRGNLTEEDVTSLLKTN
jgi:beta-lactamase regulating signal transducer with metallopeptidase domain